MGVSNKPREVVNEAGNGPEPEDEDLEEEEEQESDLDDENHSTIRAKWCIDGCRTLEECALALEAYAEHLRQMKRECWELTDEVSDDYGFIRRN
jgi:hypothetical protein